MRTDHTQTPALTFYYQDDHEGSITHLTNASGNVIERYTYDAFGAPSIFLSTGQPINLSTVGNRFLFTGREYVSSFGIYEYRNRAYHPGLGRFMSEDPKGFVKRITTDTITFSDASAADTANESADWSFEKHPNETEFNLFRYCGNDPIDLTDPLGLFPERDFIAGVGDTLTFGQAEKIADFVYPGYAASVDHDSSAYHAGSTLGIPLGIVGGQGEVAAGRQVLTAAKFGEVAAAKAARDANRQLVTQLKEQIKRAKKELGNLSTEVKKLQNELKEALKRPSTKGAHEGKGNEPPPPRPPQPPRRRN